MLLLRRLKVQLVLLVALCAAIVALSVPSPSQAASTSTITYAEMPGANPDFIFPYVNCNYNSPSNVEQFQQLMYRPLYWFGVGASTGVSSALSLASAPVYNKTHTAVQFTMKGWKFADGQVVNARSVMFFLNMYASSPLSFCGYEQGSGIPDEVKSVAAVGNTVRITFTKAVNPTWMTDDFLSEITPMPNRWDRTSASQLGHCSSGAYHTKSTDASCLAVEAYLTGLATNTKTFTSALWHSGDDGPWRLTAIDATGDATFEANRAYSGPQKAQVKVVKEVAYTSGDQELADLQNGKLDIGYVDPSMLPKRTSSKSAGPNIAALAAGFNLEVGSWWGFNEAIFNFNGANAKSAAIDQLYVRQALQESVDQPAIVTSAMNGYGYPSDSPIPVATPTALAKAIANPYPFSLANAKALLTSHGWSIVNSVMTCDAPGTSAGQCGANIAAGYTLNLNVVVAANSPELNDAFNQEIADWAQLGVVVTENFDTANNVVNDCSATSTYQLCALNAGWSYANNYFPSGEELFAPSGPANFGSYSDATMTSLINATTSGSATLTAYATYASRQLPVLYQPQVDQILEVAKRLKSSIGFTPSPLATFTPEYYHF